MAMNVRAMQEASGFGVSWQSKEEACTDAHDVVLVPLHWGNGQESQNSAAQPVKKEQGEGTEAECREHQEWEDGFPECFPEIRMDRRR